jgi:hypothetical protein
MVSRNGLDSEGLNRWRSAGFFREKRSVWIVHVWIADCPSPWKLEMELCFASSRKA